MFTKTLNVLLLCLTSLSLIATAKPIASNDLNVMPLMNGQMLPSAKVANLKGETLDLLSLTQGKPSIIFFYRGGWCPFCNSQMGQLKEIEPKLIEMGFQLIGISPDSPEKLNASMIDQKLSYTLLSDTNLNAMQAFGLAYYTSEKTTERYMKKLKLDELLKVTPQGDKRLVLPVPAIYISDGTGLIHFQYVNPNFRVRPAPQLIEMAASLVPM
ncbi:peroxiredoxin-like family protein [Shewanella woodyi]|uniref:thioredoxin-dependent peroxiredoxin n=1 Tax=Shewanella woodyi (strain ATCC 51908 / MS32) TaxID=392500 RepID=B1KH79_SHEWM|nr:peroxiredoxin-like family protein [Shewanella woodyi]ACA85387.1 alkyl hydroperoxide reductase/ Thiol specific antioxidant/ Mal allergen [Shewanella woodyi ATCC 51908]